MVDFFDQYQKKCFEASDLQTGALPRETGFFVRFVIKLSGGIIRSSQDALRILFVVFVIFSLVSVYLLYRSQQSHVYDYLPEYLQKK